MGPSSDRCDLDPIQPSQHRHPTSCNFYRFAVEKGNLQLDEMVRDVLREMRPSYPATRVTLSELPIIHADPVVVRHVLLNVIANAFKYSALAPQPAVEVSIDTSGALQVIDKAREWRFSS
jgi:signal transduction histidine kinase